MRGDRPIVAWRKLAEVVFTPHARGSTLSIEERTEAAQVYPACAGIDLELKRQKGGRVSLPRMRGDRPVCRYLSGDGAGFTPACADRPAVDHQAYQNTLRFISHARIDLGW